MEEYDFSKELEGVYKHNLFSDDTIRYYLNGFIEALGIQLDNGNIEQLGFEKKIDRDGNDYVSDTILKKDDQALIYFIKNKGKNDWLEIKGSTDNLSYYFDLFYNSNKLNRKNILPFEMCLEINDEDNDYSLIICSSNVTCFNFVRRSKKNFTIDNYSFYVKKNNFELALSIMMKFIENPDYAIDKYKSIKKKKR